MKRIFDKIIGWLNGIPADKYKHFAVGTAVAAGEVARKTIAYVRLYKENKLLSTIAYSRSYEGAVPYDTLRTLTDVQKQQARTNMGVQSADELLEDADFIAQLETKLGIA